MNGIENLIGYLRVLMSIVCSVVGSSTLMYNGCDLMPWVYILNLGIFHIDTTIATYAFANRPSSNYSGVNYTEALLLVLILISLSYSVESLAII